ncbi:hypothetical protein HGRIS_013409 [Hohenbuehelia grisea]|uniref:Cyclic-AMP phosphodiesterase n=1 Tax=Hohenbuehelia grisea TaxID=104357 RepID=A0ABR3IVN4_9AGAR
MPTFDMLVVGVGGGPDETNLSAYLVKPCGTSWKDGIIALEAGSGQGALNQILAHHPGILASCCETSDEVASQTYSAAELYSFVQCYLISHAHLDHVNSLVISAGSLRGPRKRIYAADQTLRDLETIFSDRIWPNLASWKESDEDFKLLYTTLACDGKYQSISEQISVRTMPLSHGTAAGDGSPGAHEPYTSSAFFIRHDASSHEFLFFGDVEPDSLAHLPRTIDVWRAAAPKIPARLSTVFIECSWPADRRDDMLYGHLNPPHLVAALLALATEVVKARSAATSPRSPVPSSQVESPERVPLRKKHRKNPSSPSDLTGSLDGLTVYIIHCKHDLNERPGARPVRERILLEVQDLVAPHCLGVEILAVEQGMRLGNDTPISFGPQFDQVCLQNLDLS